MVTGGGSMSIDHLSFFPPTFLFFLSIQMMMTNTMGCGWGVFNSGTHARVCTCVVARSRRRATDRSTSAASRQLAAVRHAGTHT
jgi:hypothetical protein